MNATVWFTPLRLIASVLILLICLVGCWFGISTYVTYRENLAVMEALTKRAEASISNEEVQKATFVPSPITIVGSGSPTLLLSANTSAPSYELGDEILVGITLINRGTKALVLPNAFSLSGPYLQMRLFEDGNVVSLKGSADTALALQYPCQFLVLNPGETYGAIVSLSRGRFHFDLKKSGEYRLETTYTVWVSTANSALSIVGSACSPGAPWGPLDSWTGTISASPVEFKIVVK